MWVRNDGIPDGCDQFEDECGHNGMLNSPDVRVVGRSWGWWRELKKQPSVEGIKVVAVIRMFSLKGRPLLIDPSHEAMVWGLGNGFRDVSTKERLIAGALLGHGSRAMIEMMAPGCSPSQTYLLVWDEMAMQASSMMRPASTRASSVDRRHLEPSGLT